MGVEKKLRQVAQPYTQTSGGSTSVAAFTVNGSASTVKVTVTTTAKEIAFLIGTNYTLYTDADIYLEIAQANSSATSTVTAATTSSPILKTGLMYNFAFDKGQKMSVIVASGTATLQLLPSTQ